MMTGERLKLCSCEVSRRLLKIAEEKESILAVAADVTTKKDLLELAESVGPHICILKTHIDIISDFDWELILRLKELASRYNFLIFEDRKFSDIGSTVKKQYAEGLYKISEWADIVNAHIIPGEGVILGLREAGLPRRRALLLIAQMSSNNFITPEYTKKCVELAEKYSDFVMGFISLGKISDNLGFMNFTPGISFENKKDNLGQRYLTPEEAVGKNKTDIIIVGRDIYNFSSPGERAKEYRELSWKLKRWQEKNVL